MPLFKLMNSNKEIDFDDLKYLEWKSNWNGGNWNEPDVINNHELYDFFIVSENNTVTKVDATVRQIKGSDYDMGRT